MLNDLRQYITHDKIIDGEGNILKMICERSHKRGLCVDFVEQIRDNLQYFHELETPLFENIADNYHLSDITGADQNIILQLLVSCFGESASVETDRSPAIYTLSYLYEHEECTECRYILDFLEKYIDDESNVVLDCLTDPSLTESEVNIKLDQANYDYCEEEVLCCIFRISEDEEKYIDFEVFMEAIDAQKVNETCWILCIVGYDDGVYFSSLCDVNMNDFIELVSEFNIQNSFDSFDNVFGNLQYGMNMVHARIIDTVMNARRTETEVLM